MSRKTTSRKTIVFKMPATQSPSGDDAPGGSAAVVKQNSRSAAARKSRAVEVSIATEPDSWVQDREVTSTVAVESLAIAPPERPADANASLTVDLAGQRNLAEVVALSFIAPPLLCWFWGVNSIRAWGNLALSRRE